MQNFEIGTPLVIKTHLGELFIAAVSPLNDDSDDSHLLFPADIVVSSRGTQLRDHMLHTSSNGYLLNLKRDSLYAEPPNDIIMNLYKIYVKEKLER